VDPQEAQQAVLHWLRKEHKVGPKSLADLSARTKLGVHDIARAIAALQAKGVNIQQVGDRFDIPARPPQSYVDGAAVELVSRGDNTFVFGAFGDLHAASKHTRWDARQDLIRQAEAAGAQCIFDTGNWIDGESHFNRYDLEVVGLEQQCQMLARRHPRTSLPIYAVAGDDHEGWYAQREGINVGKYNESIMRAAGHDWTDLGYMEAHVTLRNANSGKKATLAVVHPGGGSAYALSYSIQKIVESYEGGEKPNVGLYGHYHKLWAGIIRNIFVVQTGCQQDQTPFMRKKRLEAHVGGVIVTLEQDPRTGAILAMTPRIIRYFNEAFEKGSGRWSKHGPVRQVKRSAAAIRA
jgi:biotin operon repressor